MRISNAEGRKILKENLSLGDLIGEELSQNLLNQFVNKDTYEGNTVEKIIEIDKSEQILLKRIDDGPNDGQSFEDFYKRIFLDLA